MSSLFKYLRSEYLEAFVKRGHILFRSLSYFRNYEELQVRGDRYEGQRLFVPAKGLEITKITSGEKFLLPWAFESSVRDRDIFVFCLSHVRSEQLARKFGANVCVEIQDPILLLSRVRSAIALRRWVKHARLLHGSVEYYSPEAPPFAQWAVPERMVMRKTVAYSHQQEYRLAFARGDALQANNVQTQITATPGAPHPTLEGHTEHVLHLGSLAKICTIHTCKEH